MSNTNQDKGVVTVVYVDDTQTHSEHLVKGTSYEVAPSGALLIAGDPDEAAVFAPGAWVSAHVRKVEEN